MKISSKKLIETLPNATAVLLTHSDSKECSTEIWIKFKNMGYYLVIDFEQPLPKSFTLQKLVGSGNALNCSESKKDVLIQYNSKNKILAILNKSIEFRHNMPHTVLSVIEFANQFKNIIQ